MQQHNMLFGSMGETSWHQRWHTEGSMFPFTVVCTCQNGACFFVVVCCFMYSSCTPAALLYSTTETPGGSGKYSNMCLLLWSSCVCVCICVCVCVWGRVDGSEQYPASPKHILSEFALLLSPAFSHTNTHTHLLSLSPGQYFCWAARQNIKASSNLGPFLHLQTRFSLLRV